MNKKARPVQSFRYINSRSVSRFLEFDSRHTSLFLIVFQSKSSTAELDRLSLERRLIMSETQEAQSKTYRGNCHCGAFVYEATIPEIKTVYSCDCSICTKKGYLWTLVPDEAGFKVVKGDEATLTDYKFGPKERSHKVTCPEFQSHQIYVLADLQSSAQHAGPHSSVVYLVRPKVRQCL